MVEMGTTHKSFDGMLELMVKQQIQNVCHKDLSLFLRKRNPKTLADLVIYSSWADRLIKRHIVELELSGGTEKVSSKPKEGQNVSRNQKHAVKVNDNESAFTCLETDKNGTQSAKQKPGPGSNTLN